LGNLLRKENHTWWGTRRWWVQAWVWTAVIDGLLAVVLFVMPIAIRMDPTRNIADLNFVEMGLQSIFQVGMFFLAAGVIVLGQGLLVGERELGVTEWLLTKPVSRVAYVLAKLIASLGGILVTMIALPCGMAYVLFAIANGSALPLDLYLTCVLGLTLHTLFYLTLTLMLGSVTGSREKLLGLAMGTLFGGLVIPGFMGKLAIGTPWVLPNLLPALGTGSMLPVSVWIPISMTAVFVGIFVGIALHQFKRLEF
jgi:ABC-2 type transport system permease protein